MNTPMVLVSNLSSHRAGPLVPMSQELSTLQNQRWAKDRALRVLLFVIGFSPIGSLSLSTFDLIPLHLSGPMIVAPAVLLALLIAAIDPEWRRRIATGFLLGLAAVTLYDLTRLPFVTMGLWADFIPKIGNYLLDRSDVHWSVGYAWRYLGNGGGMGLALYAAAPLVPTRWRRPLVGLAYGVGVFTCLLATIYLSPSGTKYLFQPTLLSAGVGLIGHMVYGVVLGLGAERFPMPPPPERGSAGILYAVAASRSVSQ